MTIQAPPFDTYRAIERLINSGVDKKQAEAIAEYVSDRMTSGVATSTDIETLRADIARLETRMAEQSTLLTNQTWKIVLIGVGLVGAMIAYATNLILSAPAG